MKNYLKLIIAFILSWLIPGFGYLVLNKRIKAFLLFVSIILLVLAGIVTTDFRDIRFVDNPYYYVGRFGSGLIWGITIMLLHPQPNGIIPIQYFDIGHLYLCVADTLNLLIALSIFNQRFDEVKAAFNETSKSPIPESNTPETISEL